MNYPPGMTKHDWEYLDGVSHYEECPLHEDSVTIGLDSYCICDESDRDRYDDEMEKRRQERRDEGRFVV